MAAGSEGTCVQRAAGGAAGGAAPGTVAQVSAGKQDRTRNSRQPWVTGYCRPGSHMGSNMRCPPGAGGRCGTQAGRRSGDTPGPMRAAVAPPPPRSPLP